MLDFANIEKYRENNRIEAKKALGGLPHSIWETYSAFANTFGGIILLGVEEYRDKSFHTVDLPSPDSLIEEFLRLVNDKRKASANILSDGDITVETVDGNRIVAIRVPRAPLCKRPIYVENDIFGGTYRRCGEGDCKCSPEEIRKMLLDAEKAAPATPPLRIRQKKKIVQYLTRHIYATTQEISLLLGISPSTARTLLKEMTARDIVVPEGAGRARKYRLKA